MSNKLCFIYLIMLTIEGSASKLEFISDKASKIRWLEDSPKLATTAISNYAYEIRRPKNDVDTRSFPSTPVSYEPDRGSRSLASVLWIVWYHSD